MRTTWRQPLQIHCEFCDGNQIRQKLRERGSLMETFQQIMYGFYVVMMLAAIGIAIWFYKKRKESGR